MGGGIFNVDYNVCMLCKCFNVRCISCYASTPFSKITKYYTYYDKNSSSYSIIWHFCPFLFNLAIFFICEHVISADISKEIFFLNKTRPTTLKEKAFAYKSTHGYFKINWKPCARVASFVRFMCNVFDDLLGPVARSATER